MRHHFMFRRAASFVFAAGALASVPSITQGAPERRHVHLIKSEPAANDTIAAPKAIKLWFSEKVELKVTSVKLTTDAGAIISVGALTRADGPEIPPVVAAVSKPLAPGAYKVAWSTAADDGHPTKGTIDFVVKSAR